MKLFKVEMSSAVFCGFEEVRYIEAENENELMESTEYKEMFEHEKSYIFENLSESDFEEYGDEVEEIFVLIEEIDEEM
jgi:hypothetical protein